MKRHLTSVPRSSTSFVSNLAIRNAGWVLVFLGVAYLYFGTQGECIQELPFWGSGFACVEKP
ncbi:MAG: hypothetical protein IOD12_18535 [Silvanigrellales bacterium]|jgi:hypothetical protein|nr:hypothetical protein [Silvanigrellales bacterium]